MGETAWFDAESGCFYQKSYSVFLFAIVVIQKIIKVRGIK